MMDSTTLMFEQARMLSVRAASVRLNSNLAAYRLLFELELQFLDAIEPSLSEIRLPGEAHVSKAHASASPRLVGSLRLDRFGSILPPARPGARLTEYATTELAPIAVEELEAIRDGNGLTFQLRFNPIVVQQSQLVPLTYVQVEIEVNQAAWLILLEQSGYRKTLLFELPFPDARLRPNLATAISHLEDARLRFLSGQYRATVAKCREVLEALGHAVKEAAPTQELRRKDPRTLDKSERWLLLQRGLVNLAHLAHHGDPLASSTKWERDEARGVLGMTVALLNAVGEGENQR